MRRIPSSINKIFCVLFYAITLSYSEELIEDIKIDSLSLNTDSYLDVLPKLIKESPANYPDSLIKEGIEGVVLLELLIDTAGSVDSVIINQKLNPILDSLSKDAAKKLVFKPALVDNNAVPVFLLYEYRFFMDDVIGELEEYVNLSGKVLMKGTREKISDAIIAVSYCDSCLYNNESLNSLERKLPFDKYLEVIGDFDNQWIEEGFVVTKTDSIGNFRFNSLPTGIANVKVVASNFIPYNEIVNTGRDSTHEMIVRLKPEDYNDLSVTVYGKRETDEVVTRTLEINEIKSVPGFSKDVVKAVRALPGIARPAYGGEDISIRGADPSQNRYYFDGISIPYLWHFNVYGSNSILNTNVIKDMSLFSGGFSSRYGNALGGIMSFSSKDIRNDMIHGVFDLGFTNTSLTLEFPVKEKVGVFLSLRRDYIMSIFKLVSEKIQDEEMDWGGYYSDYFLKVQYKPTEKHNLFGVVFGTKDTLFEEYPEQGDGNINKEDAMCDGKKFTQFILGWDYDINTKLKNTMRVGFRKVKRTDKYGDFFKITHDGFALEIKDELMFELNKNINLFGGIDFHIEPDSMKIKFSFDGNVWGKGAKMNSGPLGGYFGCKVSLLSKVEINPEFRLDYYPDPNFKGSILPEFWDYEFDNNTDNSVEPSFRLSTKYDLNKSHNFKFSAGTYNQNPNDVVMSAWQDDNLKVSKGSQFTLGYEGRVTDYILIGIDGYVNKQWDRIRYSTAEEYEKDPDVVVRSGGEARMKGLEFLIKHERKKRFSGWLTYTLAHSERYNVNKKRWELYDGDMMHNFQLVANWKLKRGVEFGTRMQITDGLPYTPRTMEYYDSDYSYYESTAGKKNSKRHSPYLGLDLRLDKTYTLKRTMITLYLESIRTLHWLSEIKKSDGTPLYSPKESNNYYYDYSGFTPDINFPLPGLGMEIKF